MAQCFRVWAATRQSTTRRQSSPWTISWTLRSRRGASARRLCQPLCLLDPDGDLVRYLTLKEEGHRSDTWPCYHSDLHLFARHGQEIGVVGCVVGAPYAVLVAEELFYLGCDTLISITSAGLLDEALTPPFFLLVEEAIRDEDTSCHYLPPDQPAVLAADVTETLAGTMTDLGIGRGVGWTTDAPFRETPGGGAVRLRDGQAQTDHLFRPCDQSLGDR